MQSFFNFNPIVVAIYFLAVCGISMFCMNPFLLLLSLIGAFVYFITINKNGNSSHGFYLLLFAVMALINPMVSHNGVTVLFVFNDSPITMEAIIYGITASAMIIAVLYWFRSFTLIMTSDKLLYIFGKLSPRLALILSMAIRYVPLFTRQAKKINQSQTALGLYREDNVIDRIKGRTRVFSILITWALEGGIITADSMTARGYGNTKRSHFSIFKFQRSDLYLLLSVTLLSALTCISISQGAMSFIFYPAIEISEFSALSLAGYISYGILVLLPTILEAEEKIKWKYLISRI